jgi:hypothetical protein
MLAFKSTYQSDDLGSQAAAASPSAPVTAAMLTPIHAWRLLCHRTGGGISRTTFYRWLSSGKVYSIRLGYRLFVPYPVVEELIKQCLAGERY